jgi:hypothetical protein
MSNMSHIHENGTRRLRRRIPAPASQYADEDSSDAPPGDSDSDDSEFIHDEKSISGSDGDTDEEMTMPEVTNPASDYESLGEHDSDMANTDEDEADDGIESGTDTNGEGDANMDDVVEMEEAMKKFEREPARVPRTGENSDLDDFDDPDALFNGNIHPAEHYREQLKWTNPNDFRRKEYAKGTEKLIVNSENQWRMHVSPDHMVV